MMHADISALLDSFDFAEALELAAEKAASAPAECAASSDFLALASRACIENRQWALAQLLSLKALSVDTFSDSACKEEASSIFAFTAGCDLVTRVIPESPLPHSLHESVEQVLAWFDEVPGDISNKMKRKFLTLITGYCDWPARTKNILISHFQSLEIGPSNFMSSSRRRVKQLRNTTDKDWVLQIDASEIGNEARYANHADFSNGILVKRASQPHLVALRKIEQGDEITINYGSAYWTRSKPGTDSLLLGQVITHPFTECIYYDGVVEDFACTRAPGGFLLPPHSSHAKRIRRSDTLQVKQVPRGHPAYPGFGLFAKREFRKGDIICIYAGIVDHSPHSGRHASKYAVDLTTDVAIGPFGFSFDPVSLTAHTRQKFMPFLTDFPDISLPQREDEPGLLSDISSIADLDENISNAICRALLDPRFRLTMEKKLSEIKPPLENPNRRDVQLWQRHAHKVFANTFTKPPVVVGPPPTRNEPELQILLEN